MGYWLQRVKKSWLRARRPRPYRRPRLTVELLEARDVPSANPASHVLILSVDGLHQADVADPNLAADLTNMLKLQQGGVSYSHASTSKPSDSFPGALSWLTGAGPGT